MHTYLDHYSQGLAAKMASQATAETTKEIKFWKDVVASDGMALKYVANNAYSLFADPKNEETLNSLNEALVETLLFQSKLVPFLNAHDKKPLALQLTPQVLRSLAAADISNDIKKLGREIAEKHGSVYIDTPSNEYVLNDRYALRALIVDTSGIRLSQTKPGAIGITISGLKACVISFTAVFFDLEWRTYRRIAWDEGSDQVTGKGLLNWQSVIMEKADVETKSIMSDIENLFWLSLSYMKTEEENGDIVYDELPYLAHDHARRQGRKAAQTAKKFCLFRVKKITGGTSLGRHANSSSRDRLPGIGVRLHEVRGHFRLQPFGVGRSQRRLQWIEAFKRGSTDSVPMNDIQIVSTQTLQGAIQ